MTPPSAWPSWSTFNLVVRGPQGGVDRIERRVDLRGQCVDVGVVRHRPEALHAPDLLARVVAGEPEQELHHRGTLARVEPPGDAEVDEREVTVG